MPSGPAHDPGSTIPRLAPGVETIVAVPGVIRLRSAPYQRGPVMRLLARILRLKDRAEVELDDIGTWVVERFDGRSLGELAWALANHLKLSQREAETALGDFLRLLLSRNLATLAPAQVPAQAAIRRPS